MFLVCGLCVIYCFVGDDFFDCIFVGDVEEVVVCCE